MPVAESKLQIVISAVDRASKVAENVGRRFGDVGKRLEGVGRSLTTRLTLPLMGVGAIAVKTGLDFQKGLEYANTMLKLSGKNLDDFKKGILDLSNKYGKSAEDISRAAYSVSSVLHTSGKDTLTILDAITAGAKAGKISTEDAGNAIIRMMSIYNVKAKDTQKLVDTLAATVKAGNANWQDMAYVLPQVAGLAKPLGVSIQDLSGAFAALSGKTGSSFEAGTALRGVLNALIKPSKDLQKALNEMGYSSGQAAVKSLGLGGVLTKLGNKYGDNATAIGKLFPNIRAITGFTGLFANKGKDLASALDMVRKSTGETQKQIEAGRGPAEKFTEAIVRLKNSGIKLFETIEPYLERFMNWMVKMVNWFDELSPRTKKWILIVAGIAAVLGPVLFILGNLMKAINGVSMTVKVFGGVLKWLTFSSGPFGLVLIGLTALGTGIYLLIRHWKEVERITIEIWNRIKDNVLFIWDSLFGGIKRTWDRIMGLFTSVKNRVSGVFRGATDWLLSKRIGERQFGELV